MLAGTWKDHYGPTGPGFAIKDATERAERHGLPTAIVALGDNGQAVGTATLSRTSFGAKGNESPWITGLCVAPEHRGHGIGTALVQYLTQFAETEGIAEVFATTINAAGLMRRAGFRQLRTVEDKGQDWQVMHRRLK